MEDSNRMEERRQEIRELLGFDSVETHADHIVIRIKNWRSVVEEYYQVVRDQLTAAAAQLDEAPYAPGNVERCMRLSDNANRLRELLGGKGEQ